jgi:hypothetical protein
METFQFERFARTEKCWLGTSDTVDVCMDAMEEGMLPVIAKQWGFYYLWEFYSLRTDQWARLCGLLQRNRLPQSLLWESSALYTIQGGLLTQFTWFAKTLLQSRVPVARLGRGAGMDKVACCVTECRMGCCGQGCVVHGCWRQLHFHERGETHAENFFTKFFFSGDQVFLRTIKNGCWV